MALIETHDLTKVFRSAERGAGLRGAVAALFSRSYTEVTAVDHATFQIEEGEIVGYVGPQRRGQVHYRQDADRGSGADQRPGDG